MGAAKFLYADVIKPDKLTAMVLNRAKLDYNLQQADPTYAKVVADTLAKHDNAVFVMTAGRFIVVVTIIERLSLQAMLLLDLQNNRGNLERVLETLENEAVKNRIREAFDLLKDIGEAYYAFELSLGLMPTN